MEKQGMLMDIEKTLLDEAVIGKRVRELAEQIAAEYEVEKEVAKRDAAEFLARFLQAGFVECTKEDKTW